MNIRKNLFTKMVVKHWRRLSREVMKTPFMCDKSNDWCEVIYGYRLFRRHRQGSKGRDSLYQDMDSVKSSLKNSYKQVESLWVRIRD